jgi:trimeric autotransporter adhesin
MYNMKKILLILLMFWSLTEVKAQFGVGTTEPNRSAQLDVVSINKGVLIPRIALKSPTDAETISSGNVESLLVFNTTDNSSITPGYYYWFKGRWRGLVATGTNSGTGSGDSSVVYYDAASGTFFTINKDGDRVSLAFNASGIFKGSGTPLGQTFAGAVAGNIYVDTANGKMYVLDSKNSWKEISGSGSGRNDGEDEDLTAEEIVKKYETITVITKNLNGSYTYTNERGVKIVIDIIDAVVNNFNDIINNTEVQKILNEYIASKNGEGSVSFDGSKFYYVVDGKVKEIDLSKLIKSNETITTLTGNATSAVYTYTSENGTVTKIEIAESVINNFEEILNQVFENQEVINVFNEYITNNAEGNVTFDGTKFYYVTEEGNKEELDISDLIASQQAYASLKDNGDGSYTFNSGKAGSANVKIDVVADVTNNFEEILNQVFENEEVINIFNEYITGNPEGTVIYDGSKFYYYNAAGDKVEFSFGGNGSGVETVTTLIGNDVTGIYVYTSENNTKTTINIVKSVTNNFEEILNQAFENEDVVNFFNEFITNNAEGNVTFDGTKFYYVTEEGNKEELDISDLIASQQAYASLKDNGDGSYTFNSGKAGSADVKIDVVADVTNNFEEILNQVFENEEIINIFNEYITGTGEGTVIYDGSKFYYYNAEGDKVEFTFGGNGSGVETVTTLIGNDVTGIYVYTSENNTKTTINIVSSVTNNFEEILNQAFENEDVVNFFNEFITNNAEGNVTFDGTKFYYVTEEGNKEELDISDLIASQQAYASLKDNGDGSYTFNSGKAGSADVKIDVVADVTNNFEEILNQVFENEEIINIFNEYITGTGEGTVIYDGSKFYYYNAEGDKVEFTFGGNGSGVETVTTLIGNDVTGIYVYTSENNTKTTINIVSSVTNNFEEILNQAFENEDVVNIFNEFITNNAEGNVTFDGTKFYYVTEEGNKEELDISDLIASQQSYASLKDNGDGSYTFNSGKAGSADVKIDVVSDVTNNFEEILNQVMENEEIVNIFNQYITGGGEGAVTFDGSKFYYADASGNKSEIDLSDLVSQNETVTTIVKNSSGGIYTYRNEAGDAVAINIVEGVQNNISEIFNNEGVKEFFSTYLESEVEGAVTFDGSKFYYADANGNKSEIDLSDLVSQNETVTTMDKNSSGSIYTYTNEAGDAVAINIVEGVQNNISEIFNNEGVKEFFSTYLSSEVEGAVTFDGTKFYYADSNGDKSEIDLSDLVSQNETLTTMDKNSSGSIYTYTNEAGDAVAINIVEGVQNNISEIFNNEGVKEFFSTYLASEVEGAVTFDGTKFYYADSNGDKSEIDLNELLKPQSFESDREQNTGQKWIDDKDIFWNTFVITKTDVDAELDLSSKIAANTISTVVDIMIVNNTTKGISREINGYDVATNKLTFGSGNSFYSAHDAVSYTVVIKYTKQ